MLTTFLNSTPLTKFLLIQDCLEQPNTDFVRALISIHKKFGNIHYFTFEGVYKTISGAAVTYDCVSNCDGWVASAPATNFVEHIKMIPAEPTIIFIDSLVHAVMQHGFTKIYNIINELMANKNVLRTIAVFHLDLETTTLHYFQYLSTMHLILQPQHRISYVYKKNRKILSETESYTIEDGVLKSEKVCPVDVATLIKTSMDPDTLSTFKISLNDGERELRDQMVLPYLPKVEAEIIYEFDHIDDWDEEDPDDDLGI